MSKLKQKFQEIRKSTPRRAQWLLLGAAFVVVLILLTILLGGKNDNSKEVAKANVAAAELKIVPDMINWADVTVGEKKEQKVNVAATAPVVIKKVEQRDDIKGYITSKTTCINQVIDDSISCDIMITFAPGAAIDTKQTSIDVIWHKKDEAEDMSRTTKIVLTLGAKSPVIEEKNLKKTEAVAVPEPVIKPEPIETIEATEEEFIEEEPETFQEEIVREIEAIAPPVKVTERKAEKKQKKEIVIPDGCSDFAFPAYNNAGRQIGWIKPSGGAYYYHTFADKNCTEPSGKYNPDNGIITDDSGKKIGTDADHIGYATIKSGELPQLSNIPAIKPVNRAKQNDTPIKSGGMGRLGADGIEQLTSGIKKREYEEVVYGTSGDGSAIVASQPYDRSFVLRQYKPIPATIVSEVRADADVYAKGKPLPVRATVDRNVYSDDGRNIIVPAGTLMLGYVTGDLPGPYKAIGRMQIKWYQFIRPDGVEFNFNNEGAQPFAGDAQGRVGVPGRGSTDYLEQFFMPMLTAVVPAAVNLIAPISDRFVNQIDLDNNTVVQSGTVRSSELAKNEIITAWNQVAQKLMVDMMDNTVPPFTIAAGTRITVFSPEDLIVVCPDTSKECHVDAYYNRSKNQNRFDYNNVTPPQPNYDDGSWVGQVRSFAVAEYCTEDGDVVSSCKNGGDCGGYDYRTILFYCQANQYKAINMARQDAVYQNQQQQFQEKYDVETNAGGLTGIQGDQAYNEQVLGLTYNEETGAIENPFTPPAPPPAAEAAATETLLCLDNTEPDANGCCTGEIYTDMGEQGFNCCPETGGDCFPPMF